MSDNIEQVFPQSDIPIIIRPALKRTCCENDACRAAIYNQLLYSIARKVKKGEEYWYGTYQDICTSLDNSWGLSKIMKETGILIKQGFILQRRNPKNGYDQTRQYLFGLDEAKKFKDTCKKAGVCVHRMAWGADVLHLLHLTNAFIESNDCICLNQRMDSLNPTIALVKSNDAIPKSTTKNTTKNTTKREGSKPDTPAQSTSPTNPSSPSSPEKEFADRFAFLMEKVTGVENYKAVPLTKSHKDYAIFQELVNRNPSLEEMERVLFTFWNEQDKDKTHFWQYPGRLKLNTYCRNYDAKLNAAMPQNANERHEKPSVQGMTRDNAVELEKEIIATTDKHGYEVTTNVVEEDGVWLVKMLWKESKAKIESVSHWHEVFGTMQDMTEESQKLQLA